jgi:hypothetical protein
LEFDKAKEGVDNIINKIFSSNINLIKQKRIIITEILQTNYSDKKVEELLIDFRKTLEEIAVEINQYVELANQFIEQKTQIEQTLLEKYAQIEQQRIEQTAQEDIKRQAEFERQRIDREEESMRRAIDKAILNSIGITDSEIEKYGRKYRD